MRVVEIRGTVESCIKDERKVTASPGNGYVINSRKCALPDRVGQHVHTAKQHKQQVICHNVASIAPRFMVAAFTYR